MDWIVSILLTLAVYFLIPFLLIIIGKKFSKRTLVVISIINCMIGYIFFGIINYMIGTTPNFTAAVLWSFVGYHLLKRKLIDSQIPIDAVDDFLSSPEPQTIQKPEENFTEKVSLPTNPIVKKTFFNVSTVLILINIVLILCVIFSLCEISKLKSDVTQSHTQILEYQTQLEELSSSIEFTTKVSVPLLTENVNNMYDALGMADYDYLEECYLERRIRKIEEYLGLNPW